MAGPKANKIEVERRKLAIQNWIIENVAYMLIVQQIQANGWCTSERHAKRMIAAARDKWIIHETEKAETRRRLKILQLQNQIRKLGAKYKDTPAGIRAVLAVEKEIIRLENYEVRIKQEREDDFLQSHPIITTGADIPKQEASDIDYSKLPDEALQAIMAARTKRTE